MILSFVIGFPFSLGLANDGRLLSLMHENGKRRLSFVLLDNGTALSISEGNAKASLQVGKEGPSLWMIDENGKPRITLMVAEERPEKGPSMMELLDENGMPRVRLWIAKEGPEKGQGIELRDENGWNIWSAP
jgi:hypothetical protein